MNRRRLLTLALTTVATLRADSTGVLLLAHGSRVQSWNEEVNRIAASVNKTHPTEVAFGMATRSAIQSAIDRLAARGVNQIVAVPLFVSSHSSVVRSTEWLLGLRAEMPEDYRIFAKMSHGRGGASNHAGHSAPDPMTPIGSPVPVRMTPALNRHPIMADILLERARSLSKNPPEEVVILVAHGPNPDSDNAKWLADLGALAERMRPRTSYQRIEYLTVRDDAPEPVRSQAKAELRGLVENAVKEGKRALIVPVVISYGGIETGVRKRLGGLEYKMAAQGLLPDSRITDWILESVRSTRTP